jgi:hypothetical protein
MGEKCPWRFLPVLVGQRVPDNEALNLSPRFAPRRLTPVRYEAAIREADVNRL